MDNNVKDFLAKTVFRMLYPINRLIPKKGNRILLYSNAGFRDNVRAVYEYLIAEGYNKKYEIIISSDSLLPESVPSNVKAVSCKTGVLKYFSAGHVFYCQGKIPVYPAPGQFVVQMWHGTPFKGNNSRGDRNATVRPFYSHVLSPSPYYEQIFIDNFFVNKENVAICGQPRTDVMYEDNPLPNELDGFRKLIMWMPTYRKSSVLGDEDVRQKSIVPIFSMEELAELEKKLESMNICLLIKLHPLQDLDMYKNVHYKNMILLSGMDFENTGWDLYRLLSRADALISDYSSVFFDYMLMDRPIGFAIDDIEEYVSNRGFVVEDPDYFMAGEKIRDKEDFYAFLDHVFEGADPFREQRNEVSRITHTYTDGQNCKRALEIGGVSLS